MADDDPAAGVDPTDAGAVADVLYRLDPGAFIAQRTAFVTAARAAGDKGVAQQIQGFGRPTRAAWVLNRLARDAPDVVTELAELGAALAAAQADLDATSLRELSDRRRALVREVSRRAFQLVDEPRPSTALATEVQDTLTAAVVDPAVGEALQAGALLKAAQASGFGPTGPELAAVPAPRALRSVPPAPREPSSSKPSSSTPSSAGRSTPSTATPPTAAEKRAAAKAEREQEKARAAAAAQEAARRERVAASDRALADARTALEEAREQEKAAAEALRILREQVRDADRTLGDAGLAVREARAAVRQAEKARRDTR